MRRPLAFAGLIFIVLIFFVLILFPANSNIYQNIDGMSVSVTGSITRIESRIKDEKRTSVLYLDHLKSDEKANIFPDKKDTVICYMSDYIPELSPGSSVTVSGKAHVFETASNPGMFDSAKYYSCIGIDFSMSNCNITSVHTSGSRLKAKLNNIRNSISLLIDLCFDSSDAPVIKTILLGDKSELDADTKSLYSQNGIAHILAISGLHISMIGMAIYTLLRKCRLPAFLYCSIPAVIMLLFGIMTGMAPSAIRAIIMFSLRMFAGICHRTYDMVTAVIIAAITILIEQPKLLLYSGFQFSFGAIIAILCVYPIMSDIFPKSVSAGLSINLLTLPVYLYNYFYFPILSILLNLYVIPLMSVLLGSAIVALACCLIFIPLGRLTAFIPHVILLIYDYSCRFANTFSFNKLVTGQPEPINIFLYYAILLGILFLSRRQTRMQIILHLCLAGIILSFRPQFGDRVTMIDVGQGDGIYLSLKGHDYLIDGGSSSEDKIGERRLSPFLLSQGVASLDAVFITHLDADHYNGILELMEMSGQTGPVIQKVYISAAAAQDASAVDELITLASNHSIPIEVISSGYNLKLNDNCSLLCIYPDADTASADSNESSMTLLLDIGKVNMLLTGDLEGIGEGVVAKRLKENKEINKLLNPDEINILKVAHHGSANSSSENLLDCYQPDLALISVGAKNSYGHPHKDTLSRFKQRSIPYYCTSEYGAITVIIRKDTLSVNSFRQR